MAQATVREMGRRRDPVPPRSITDRPLHILVASPLEEEHVMRITNANLGRVRVYFELDPLPVPRQVANYSRIARSLNEVERIRWQRCTDRELAGQPALFAGLGVLETEPLPTNCPLWDLLNVLFSPQSARTVVVENRQIVCLFAENIIEFLSGDPRIDEFGSSNGH